MGTHIFLNRLSTLAMGICLGLATSTVSAETFTADFGGGSLLPDFSMKNNPDWNANFGGGFLQLEGGNATVLSSGGITFSHALMGDFTATVDVDLSSSKNSRGMLAFWNLADPSRNTALTNISLFRSSGHPDCCASIGGYDPILDAFPTNWHGLDTNIRLKMQRSGNTFSEYIAPFGSNDFHLWHSFSLEQWPSIDGRVGLRMAQSSPSDIDVSGVFSNFTVTTPVPEPETYAMMLAGLGLLGFMARRRKQQSTA